MRLQLRELAVEVATPQFARTMRMICLFSLGGLIVSEIAPLLTSAFPSDLFATTIMCVLLAAVAMLARPGVPRRHLGLLAIGMLAAMGWYMERVIHMSGGIGSPHQGTLYIVIIAAQALMPFNVLEFFIAAGLFVTVFIGMSMVHGSLASEHLSVVIFYVTVAIVMSSIGILARTRLQVAEKEAREEQERLNRTLRAEVELQVDRIRRSEVLGRYLPRELTEAVLAGERGIELGPANREVTVLCAIPAGLLEGLSELPAERVAQLVNEFVSAMGQVADLHGGVIERFVGPRVTVLFGAIDELDPEEGARRATQMAVVMQEEANMLLRQWEEQGLEDLRLRLAIGVAAGPAVVGTFGSERRAEYSAIGGAMMRAHRLAAEAVPGEVRLDELVAARLEGVVETLPGAAVEFTPGAASPTFIVAPETVPANRQLDAAGAPEGVIGLEPTALATSTEPPPLDTWRGALALPSLAPGDLFDGRYRIEKLVGRGGMAIVYCARHIALGQLRALKLILPSRLTGPDAVEQLRRESVATSRIHHPNVVRHVDFGRSLEGHYYITLDFVDGPSLAQVLRDEGRLPEAEALRIGDQILAGLQAAHALSIIHRDLKPANVLLDASRQARVTDFGLAQPPGIDLRLIAGTPAYMSPEQLRGAHVDERSDLYSFGATIYQLLTGVLPYRSLEGSITDLRGHDERVPLVERTGDVSPAICALIDRCLAASPEHRPASAAELRRALRNAASRS